MGRLWSPGKYVARPEWYDRNPAPAAQFYSGSGVAPHSATVRWTYTVPAGKKAMVEFIECAVWRRTAATTAGSSRGFIQYTPQGGSTVVLLRAEVNTLTLGDKDCVTTGQALVLKAGDALEAITEDLATGGNCDYILNVKITEFDA